MDFYSDMEKNIPKKKERNKQVYAKEKKNFEIINYLSNYHKSFPLRIIEKIKKSISAIKINKINNQSPGNVNYISKRFLNYFFANCDSIILDVKELFIREKNVLPLNLKNSYIIFNKEYKGIIIVNNNSNESLNIPNSFYSSLLNIISNIDNHNRRTNSKRKNNHILLDNISEKFNIDKIYQLICFSLNPLFKSITSFFSSPLKSIFPHTKKNLISQVKSFEYNELFSRMKERINKIEDLTLKAETFEALSKAYKETFFCKNYKKISLLKELFLQKMKNNPLIGNEIVEYANKYSIYYYNSYKVVPNIYNHVLLSKFNKERNIPKYIKDFNSKEPHMIPINQYLDVRLSQTIRLLISKVNKNGRNTEIFIGSEDLMIYYYKNLGFERIAYLKTNSSLKYYLFSNCENPSLNKIVILGVGNETKLNHLLLQLKLGEVNLDKIIIRGHLEDAIYENQQKFNDIIGNFKEEINTVFMGNRSLILLEFAKRKYPIEFKTASNENDAEKIAENLLKKHHNLKTFNIGEGVYKFSCFELNIASKKELIICFRMPNGSLARIVTETLIRKGVHHFVTLGAGGSLSSLSRVGSYQLIKSTSYLNNHILFSELNIKEMNVNLSEIPLIKNGNNITLDSPLIETRNWLFKVQNDKLTSVDVETYHIIKGIQNCVKLAKNVEFLIGIFISDVIGDCPLIEKIKSRKTWTHLPEFLKICFNYIEKPKNEKLINEGYNCILQNK